MARYIHKHVVRINEPKTQLLLDIGAEVLSVGLQYSPDWLEEVIVFYTFRTDGTLSEPREFTIVGTGHEVPEGAVHRGTIPDPPYVWHLLEVPIR